MRRTTLVLSALAVSIGGYGLWSLRQVAPVEPAAIHATASRQAERRPFVAPAMPPMSLTPSVPVRLAIPRLGVSTAVEQVGIDDRGEMSEPSNPAHAAWYKTGYVPGSLGNAVIAGHFTWLGKPSLFHGLPSLQTGDTLTVDNEHGSTLYFTVDAAERFVADDTPQVALFGSADTAQLKLITCYGRWDHATQRYTERYVVTARFTHEKTASN